MFCLLEMVNAPSIVSVLLLVCVSGAVGQMTTRTVVTRKFRYETACWDQLYGSPVSGWDYYKVGELVDGHFALLVYVSVQDET